MKRPVPRPTKISQRFWDSCRKGVFEMQRCAGCEEYSFYPVYLCPSCGSVDLAWTELKGTGTVYSCTVVEHSAGPAFDAVTPLVVALIELDEGPIMMSNVVDTAPYDVRIGDRVEVGFQPVDDAVLPIFRPIKHQGAPR